MYRAAAFALLLLVPVMQNACAAGGKAMTLMLPHPLRAGESAYLEVRVGPIRRGEQIKIATAAGERLGVISPYGVRAGAEAGTYTVPLPPAAISGDRVSVTLTIAPLDGPPRAPTAHEVRAVKLVVTGARR
jgi:hypothetical protein